MVSVLKRLAVPTTNPSATREQAQRDRHYG